MNLICVKFIKPRIDAWGMGRIKTTLIKRAASKLFDMYTGRFTEKFNDNKVVVGEIEQIQSKKMRNNIAGQVTRLVKQKKKEDAMLLKDAQKLTVKA